MFWAVCAGFLAFFFALKWFYFPIVKSDGQEKHSQQPEDRCGMSHYAESPKMTRPEGQDRTSLYSLALS